MITFIRPDIPADHGAIHALHREAFKGEGEAALVRAFLESDVPCVSLVAEAANGRIAGHILFSPVSVTAGAEGFLAAGLAPLAVLPELQGRGVGSTLVTDGLQLCAGQGYAAVFVLGHPDFYKKFRFVPAKAHGCTCVYDVPDDVFLVRELRRGALSRVSGTVHYHDFFNSLG